MIALIHIYCSTSLCVIYKSLLIHNIQVLIYRGSTNERFPEEGVAYDSYYNEPDRVISPVTPLVMPHIGCQFMSCTSTFFLYHLSCIAHAQGAAPVLLLWK